MAIENIQSGDRLKNDFSIQQVRSKEELERAFGGGLIDLYQFVFSEPPYNEKFDSGDIRQYWEDYFQSGIVFICEGNERKVIGFAAAIPLAHDPEVAELAKPFGFDPDSDWYHAEVGVDPSMRGKDLGTKILQELLHEIPAGTVLMRTQEGNVKSLGLHKKVGFQIVEDMIQEKISPRQDGTMSTDRRVFLVLKK